MKMILTSAKTPDEYIECLDGWQRSTTMNVLTRQSS